MVLEDSDVEMIVAEIEVSVSRLFLKYLCWVAFRESDGLCPLPYIALFYGFLEANFAVQ